MEDKNNQDNKIPRAKLWFLRVLSLLILASIICCFVWVYMKFVGDGIDVAIIGAIVITALYIWFLIKIGVNLWQIFTPEGRKVTKKLQEEEARKKAERKRRRRADAVITYVYESDSWSDDEDDDDEDDDWNDDYDESGDDCDDSEDDGGDVVG